MCSAAPRRCIEYRGSRVVVSGDYKRRRDPTCAPFEPQPCDVFITEATFGLPVFRHPPDRHEIDRLLHSLRLFPERCQLVGVYALGKCQRVIALLREAGYDAPIYLHGALIGLCELYESLGVALGPLLPATGVAKAELAGKIVLAPPGAHRRPLVAPPARPGRGDGLGLDARQAARQGARRRAAAGHLRPRRLGRADPDPRRCRRAGNLGHPRQRGGARPLRDAASASRPARWRWSATRTRSELIAGRSARRPPAPCPAPPARSPPPRRR